MAKTNRSRGKGAEARGRGGRRYAARLLFQLRKQSGRRSNVMRLVERRIVVIRAATPEAAWRAAVRHGKDQRWTGQPRAGMLVHNEFIGVEELMQLGGEAEENEVWWEFVAMLRPMERRARLIPPKSRLRAFRTGVWRRYGPKI